MITPQPAPCRIPSQNYPGAVDLTKIIILHPGSAFLYFGLASDSRPQCLANSLVSQGQQLVKSDVDSTKWFSCDERLGHFDPVIPDDITFDTTVAESGLGTVESQLSISSSRKWKEINKELVPRVTSESAKYLSQEFTAKDFLVGNETDNLMDCSSSLLPDIRQPFRRGRFNVHKGVGGSLSSKLADTEIIWREAICGKLKIPFQDLKFYKAILLISDLFERNHVAAMFDVLIRRLNFSSAFLQMESVCSAFGSGNVTGCVVDVGAEKTSVSCVEDGIAHATSSVQIDIGGADITRSFHWLIQKIYFPYQSCDLFNKKDALLVRKLKEDVCHCDMSLLNRDPQKIAFEVTRSAPEVKERLCYEFYVGDEAFIAPFGFYNTELFGVSELSLHRCRRPLSQPDDIFDDDYLVQSTPSYNRRKYAEDSFANEEGKGTADFFDEDGTESQEACSTRSMTYETKLVGPQKSKTSGKLRRGQGIEVVILRSVSSLGEGRETEDLKRKMLANVILVGGGLAKFPGADSLLKQKLTSKIDPATLGLTNHEPVNVDVTTSATKDVDPRFTAWKGWVLWMDKGQQYFFSTIIHHLAFILGAVIIASTETSSELWIQGWEWKAQGSRVLRERCPFVW